MIKRTVFVLILGLAAMAVACGGSTESDKPAVTPTNQEPAANPAPAFSEIGPDGNVLTPVDSNLALTAALESISGFDITDVTFRGNDVTVKYDQVVNEPPELLLLRWLDFASVAVTFVDDPNGDIVLVPQVEGTDIASVRLRAVDVIDYLDGKRPLEDLLAGIEIE